MPVRAYVAAVTLALALPVSLRAQTPVQDAARRAQARANRGQRQIICKGAAVPSGWILVDDVKEATMCGGENAAIFNSYNVWAIEKFFDRPVGSTIVVCASAATPDGWTVDDVYRDKSRCGHPSDNFAVNAKRIRRVR